MEQFLKKHPNNTISGKNKRKDYVSRKKIFIFQR